MMLQTSTPPPPNVDAAPAAAAAANVSVNMTTPSGMPVAATIKTAMTKLNGLVGFGLVGHNGLADQNGLVNCNDLVDQSCLVDCNNLVDHIDLNLFGHICLIDRVGHNGLVGFIGLGLVGFIGLSLVSLIRQISLINLLPLSNHWPIGLIGIISFGLIASSASAALLAHWPCNFSAATCQVGPIGCTCPSSFNGVSGLIGQISLVGQISLISLSGISGISGLISHNGLVGFIGLGLVDFIDLSLVSHVGLICHIIGLIGLNRA